MKKTRKRGLSLFLALLLLLSFTLPQALAAPPTSGKCGKHLTWSFKKGTLTIKGTGAMTEADSYNERWYPLKVKKVVLKEGITSLCPRAFGWCEDLSSIKLPRSLKQFGEDALTGTNLKSVSVAKGSKYFSAKDGVLFNKKKTVLYYYPTKKKGKSYTVPSSVRTIAGGAFTGMENSNGANPYLKTLKLPKKLKKIESSAFFGSAIKTFRFASGVPTVEKNAFDCVWSTILCPEKYKESWTSFVDALAEQYPDIYEEDNPYLPTLFVKTY